ncbi:UDP-N-acetylmuramate dehydrogenase [Labedaea rhizosphaerae]|uniref:UDP-N-acetylenolpyruvoylglucosamine reductase n=1 Tax=Labedaea rhizosphaerae TaxID=598644 RepID=A0A4R6SNR6_LABRH|nr:UDP-N-acetylmuramate dehydrogenase [Labedaea rhizosphaerae]
MAAVTSLPLGTNVRSAVPLAGYTTLRLGGPAARFVAASTSAEVVEAVRDADRAGEPLLVLGGGSNVVVGDDGFDGTVVHIASEGTHIDTAAPGEVQLTVEAGANWDVVVAGTVSAGLGGLECLSGIPGLVGATPVQNVGAYGVEVSQLLVSVDLLDRASGEVRTMTAPELGLGYRTSVLKGTDRAVVLRVRFMLTDDGLSAPVRYGELARVLGVEPGDRVPVADARAAVLDLRRGKGMVLEPGDYDTWSAGSFFTNPIVPETMVGELMARTGDGVPIYPAHEGHRKVSAAWLIDQAGFTKGFAGPGGRVSLSTKHTLALTNRGSASTEDLLELARTVRDGVYDAFGVTLRAEPVLIGCEL